MSNLQALHELPPRAIWEGVVARAVEGELITLAIVELPPGGLVPEHKHENEQIGLVIEGSVTFRIADQQREFGPGGTWCVVGHTRHEVQAGAEGAVVVEAFSPVRSDWADADAAPDGLPRWPG